MPRAAGDDEPGDRQAVRGDRYEAATVAHCESVLRSFYDFHLEAGSGPMLNPFPLARHARAGRAGAHRNRWSRPPGSVVAGIGEVVDGRGGAPDQQFDRLFASWVPIGTGLVAFGSRRRAGK